jgi:hypothetical protein
MATVMARQPEKKIDWLLVAAITGPILGAAMAMMTTGFIADRKLADIPYVDSRFIEGKRYTDDKMSVVLKEAFEHSDTNRRELVIEMGEMKSEYRTGNAVLSGKLDNVANAIKDLREDMVTRKHK